ncbi:MAG: hypothetical protein WAL32_18390 [Terriglobales bacterium]
MTSACSGSSDTWNYSIAALDAAGGSTAGSSTPVSVTNNCAMLTPTNYNAVTFTAPSGSVTCNIYRLPPSPAVGRVAMVPCGGGIQQTYLDNGNTTLDVSGPPSNPSTGSILATGTMSAQNFLSTGGGAGTSDWVQGMALPACTQGTGVNLTQPQPCIQTNSFFIQAAPSISSSFGWTAPSATNTWNGPVIAAAGSLTPPASTLSVAYLTNTTLNPLTSQPTLATVGTGSLPNGDIVKISNAGAGAIDLVDSGISATAAGAGTVLGNPTNSPAAPTYTSTPQLGASGVLGSIAMGNSGGGSGLLTIEPLAGASLGASTASFPANTGTVAELNLAQVFSAAGATVMPAIGISGTVFTGGSGTATVPLVYIDQGSNPSTWNTNGTEFGMNAASFTGNFADFHLNGAGSLFKVDYEGNVTAASFISGGTKFSAGSGCGTVSSLVGGATAGSFKSGAASCTVTITMGGSVQAPNGWACSVWDTTTTSYTLKETAFTTSSVTFSGSTMSGDVIVFGCKGF